MSSSTGRTCAWTSLTQSISQRYRHKSSSRFVVGRDQLVDGELHLRSVVHPVFTGAVHRVAVDRAAVVAMHDMKSMLGRVVPRPGHDPRHEVPDDRFAADRSRSEGAVAIERLGCERAQRGAIDHLDDSHSTGGAELRRRGIDDGARRLDGHAVSESAVDRPLGRDQHRDDLAAGDGVVELGVHHLAQETLPAVRRHHGDLSDRRQRHGEPPGTVSSVPNDPVVPHNVPSTKAASRRLKSSA